MHGAGFLAALMALMLSARAAPSPAATAVQPGGPVASGWTGRLQIGDRMFVDGAGRPVLPLCALFGEAFSAWVRRPEAVAAQLDAIKAAGYDCIRFWDNLGEYSEAWRGREVTPFTWTNQDGVHVQATPEYYAKLREFLRLLDRKGLAVHHSRGDLGRQKAAVALDQIVEHSRRVAAVYDEVGWHVLALYEGNNEDFQNGRLGPEGLRRVVEPIKARGAIVAASCPDACSEAPEDILEYSRGFSVRYFHAHRDGSAADRLRRKFTTGYAAPEQAPYLAWDGEPIGPNDAPGPGVTVNHTEDPEEIGLLHAMAWVAGRSASTYTSQQGVFWRGPLERQSGFQVTPRVRAVIREFAPDVMRWTLHHGARPEAALTSPDGFFGDAGVQHGPARIDQAIDPDRRRVVAFIYGGRAATRVRNDLPCTLSLTVVWPRQNEQVQQDRFQLVPGGILSIDYRVGRLLLGECIK